MRVVVFGASGKLGRALCGRLAREHEVVPVLRSPAGVADAVVLPSPWTLESAASLLRRVKAELVINAAGATALDVRADAIVINAVWPRVLALAAVDSGATLVHVSTDGVFSGTDARAPYDESAAPNAADPYGVSKRLGEANQPNVTNARLSFVGWSADGSSGLLDWAAKHAGERIEGYAEYRFTVLTTHAAADALASLAERPRPWPAILHLPGVDTTKHELLLSANRVFGWRSRVTPKTEPRIDRRLDARRFTALTGWRPPELEPMLEGIARERVAR